MSSISLFESTDYRDFLKRRIQSMPSRGHGQLAKMAKNMSVHSTLLTQILKGQKSLSLDQGYQIAEFLGLTELETEAFLCMIDIERAGYHKLKQRLISKYRKLSEQYYQPQSRVHSHQVLDSAAQAQFYSDWIYSAIRLITDLPDINSREEIAQKLSTNRKTVNETISFLLKHGLVVEKEGKLQLGISKTYLPSDSMLVTRHHVNWRLKAIENLAKLDSGDLAFTAPLTISKKDFTKVKEILLDAIGKISKIVEESDSQELACLNIDWLRLLK